MHKVRELPLGEAASTCRTNQDREALKLTKVRNEADTTWFSILLPLSHYAKSWARKLGQTGRYGRYQDDTTLSPSSDEQMFLRYPTDLVRLCQLVEHA